MPGERTVETAGRIRAAQRARGLTNEELATRTGVALRTVMRWRRGESPRLPNLARLADALDVPRSYLIQDEQRAVALEELAREVDALNERTEALAERVGAIERLLGELVPAPRGAAAIDRRQADSGGVLAGPGAD